MPITSTIHQRCECFALQFDHVNTGSEPLLISHCLRPELDPPILIHALQLKSKNLERKKVFFYYLLYPLITSYQISW